MNLALCYENVDPTRGGCETYIADFARRLVGDGHEVHLYACRWNAAALPTTINLHPVRRPRGPRFLRPWLFGWACRNALRKVQHDVSIGFDKTWGQDVLYPQGGFHSASAVANLRKHTGRISRILAASAKAIDPAARSFALLERLQYHHAPRSTMIVNSEMVRRHAAIHLGIDAATVHVVHAAVRSERFHAADRIALRAEYRRLWGIADDVPVALFVAMNYRLKGLDPLLHALRHVPPLAPFCLAVVGSPNVEAYRRLAQRLGVSDRVIFHGFCPDTRATYFAADFLVHPTFYDPCSLVVLEALACGLPVITSAANGAAELLHPPHDGLIVDNPHDHVRLANAMIQMLDPAYRRACSIQASQSATLWTFEDHYRKMMAILESVAVRKQAARC